MVELMVTVAVLAILAAIAAPRFTALVERLRARQTIEDLQATLYLARSEAIRRRGGVVLRKNPPGTDACEGTSESKDWSCGWFLFVDTSGDGDRQDGEELLQTIPPPQGFTVKRSNTGASMRFDRYGLTGGINADGFKVSPAAAGNDCSAATHSLAMASGGRITLTKGTAC